MRPRIGIRREDKNRWERRSPLTPAEVQRLVEEQGVEVWIQPSTIRVFPDEEYARVGARVTENLDGCPVVFGVKEMPVDFFREARTYVFFTHTHKGQAQNMPMLEALVASKCQLIDYERIADDQRRRLLFFGRFAGVAGMIDALWTLGRRLRWEGYDTPFASVKMAHEYASLEAAKAHIRKVGETIACSGLTPALVPVVVGIAGYGHVSQGAQEILDLLPVREISPGELLSFPAPELAAAHRVYKVVFKEEDTVAPRDGAASFDLQDFFSTPERYRSRFADYLDRLTLLMNAIYWDEQYPRLVTKADIEHLYGERASPTLRAIADIGCDVEGAIECTLRTTDPDHPVYVYLPGKDTVVEGWEGHGPVIMAVDNLPCELPREASAYFSRVLEPYVRPIATADYTGEFARCELPPEVKRAVILYRGGLTPSYEFMKRLLTP
jgi:saccharopine dehydrogenase (NAD+, L-lysine-forming)